MEPAFEPLNRVRRELVASSEWTELNKELMLMVNDIHEERASTLSVLVEELSDKVRETHVYRELQIKVSTCLTRHFVSCPNTLEQSNEMQRFSEKIPRLDRAVLQGCSSNSSSTVSGACVNLLQRNPRLKRILKNCLNHPLSRDLRMTAWRALLIQQPSTPSKKKAIRRKLEVVTGLRAERLTIGQRLSDVLTTNPLLAAVTNSSVAMETVKTLVLYWKQESGSLVLDRDILLSIPFVMVWREALGRGMQLQGATKGWVGGEGGSDGVTEVTEVYVSFMRMLPLTMSGMDTEAVQKAIEEFCMQVEHLLKSNDPKLHHSLEKILVSKKHHNKLYKGLASLLHSSIRNMLVGDLPLDVVCYIWDQCFIGRTVPHYQCLHYYIATWLILLREKLMIRPTASSVSDLLRRRSMKLTVLQFQRVFEKTFLKTLSAELLITPILLPGPHIRERLPVCLSSSSSSTVRSQSLQQEKGQRPKLSDQDLKVTVSSEAVKNLDQEKEQLRREVERLQKDLIKQHRMLTNRMEKEKLKRKHEVQSLNQELTILRKKVGRRTPTPWPSSRSIRGSPQSLSVARHGSPFSTHTPSSFSSYSSEIPPSETESSLQSRSTVASTIQSTIASHTMNTLSKSLASTAISVKSDNMSVPSTGWPQLTLGDAQDVWLKIFRRFSNGLYLLCHGVEEEKESLIERIEQRNKTATSIEHQ